MLKFRKQKSSTARRRRPIAGFEPLESRRVLATFVVTSTAGTGSGSLHQQIVRANAAAGFDEIIFDEALDGQTITLATDSLLITNGVRIDASSLPNGITIDASAADPTPGENNGDGIRAFELSPSATRNGFVEFSGLTVTGGDVTGRGGAIFGSASVIDSHFMDNAATEAGGAIAWSRTDEASLTGDVRIENSSFERNTSGNGGALFGSFRQGNGNAGDFTVTLDDVEFRNNVANHGGAAWLSGHYSMSISNSDFQDNIASSGNGGGLWLYSYDRETPSLVAKSTFTGNSAAENGGGFFLHGSSSEVRDSHIQDNSANQGGGGAVEDNVATIVDSVIEGNTAVADGGGVSFRSGRGQLVMAGAVVRNNVAGGRGGGISSSVTYGGQIVSATSISGNSAGGDGGGIWHAASDRGSFSLDASTLSENRSGMSGGGAFGISTTNSTISGNTAAALGGGLYMFRDRISFSTIVNNRSGADPSKLFGGGGGGIWGPGGGTSESSLAINHSVIAGNGQVVEGDGFAPDDVNGNGEPTSLGSAAVRLSYCLIQANLVEDLQSTNSLFDVDPMLADLADNGGPTLTHLPLVGSPVIDSGASFVASAPGTDQRGAPFARFRDGNEDAMPFYDMGAIEVQGANVPPIAVAGDDVQVGADVTVALDGSATADPDNGPFELTYLWSIVAGPEFSGGFDDATQPMTTFVSDTTGTYQLLLTVDDGADTSTDTITLTVTENGRPTASINGSDQATIIGLPALLNGDESFDADGDSIATYEWRLVSSPAESTATISNADAATASLSPDLTGLYELQLVVSDGAGNMSEAVTTRVSVVPGSVFTGGPYLVIGDDDLMLTASAIAPFISNTDFAWDLNGDGLFDDAAGRTVNLDAAALTDLQSSADQQILAIAVQATNGSSTSVIGHGTVTFIGEPDSGDVWHNEAEALDVDRDASITPVDALLVINELNNRLLSDENGVIAPAPDVAPALIDVDNDGIVSPVDALQVINGLPGQQNTGTRKISWCQAAGAPQPKSLYVDDYFKSLDEQESDDVDRFLDRLAL